MIRTNRRTLLKASAAFAGVSALGFPSIVSGQTEKIKIGHLTPLTGFLGALGAYAQLGIRMAEEEINAAGGVMGRQIDITSEDSVNPATAATKAQRMLEQDGALVLMGEINSASALTIMQVAARNKKLFMQIGARSDALRGKNCNRYTFHVDIPSTVMVNAVGKALVRDNMMKDKKFYTLTADYIFGHDLARAAKSFFDANGGKLIGDELVATDVTDFSPYLLKIRQGKPDVVCSKSCRQPGHQPDQAIRRIRPALSDRRLQPQHRRRVGGRRRQSERHLADGLVSHLGRSGVEDVRGQLYEEAWQAAGEPRLDRIRLAEDDGAGHERDQIDRYRQTDRLLRDGSKVRHPERTSGVFPVVGSSVDAGSLSVHGQGQGPGQGQMGHARTRRSHTGAERVA